MATGTRAIKAEASKQTEASEQTDYYEALFRREVTVEFNGVEYSIHGGAMENVEVLEFLEDEQYIKALRALIGRARWAQFKESIRTEDGIVPASELEKFLQVVMEALDPSVGS